MSWATPHESTRRQKPTIYPYSGATLAGNKVFMIQSKAASGAKISLGGPDVTDGIGEVKGEEGKEVKNQSDIYDLQGRRVASPVAGGVYVVGGRKVLITK